MSMPEPHTTTTAPKLPLGDTIRLSYTTYVSGFGDVLRASWLWIAIATPLFAYASWKQFQWMAILMANLKKGMPPPPDMPVTMSTPAEVMLAGGASKLLLFLAGLSIAVAWHRRMILGEHPGTSGANLFSANLWRYAGMGIALMLCAAIPPLLIAIPIFLYGPLAPGGFGPPAPQQFAFLFPLMPAAMLIAYFLLLRLIPLLPARAAGDLALTWRDTWTRTHGNVWRLFWGLAACTVPPALLMFAVSLGITGFPSFDMFTRPGFAERMAVANALFVAYYLLSLPIVIGFLSHAYRHFFRPT